MKITGFQVFDERGVLIDADAHGNNAAFCCVACRHSILAIALVNQRGSDRQHPAICKRCGTGCFLQIHADAKQLHIRQLDSTA